MTYLPRPWVEQADLGMAMRRVDSAPKGSCWVSWKKGWVFLMVTFDCCPCCRKDGHGVEFIDNHTVPCNICQVAPSANELVLQERLEVIANFARARAIEAHARGKSDTERDWLDVLILCGADA